MHEFTSAVKDVKRSENVDGAEYNLQSTSLYGSALNPRLRQEWTISCCIIYIGPGINDKAHLGRDANLSCAKRSHSPIGDWECGGWMLRGYSWGLSESVVGLFSSMPSTMPNSMASWAACGLSAWKQNGIARSQTDRSYNNLALEPSLLCGAGKWVQQIPIKGLKLYSPNRARAAASDSPSFEQCFW